MSAEDSMTEFDSFLEKNSPKKHKGNWGCVDKAVNDYPEHRDLILAVVNHPRASANNASAFLASKGIDLARGPISRHRRGECACLTK